MKELAKRFEGHAKGMLTPSTLFEEFGLNYTGPIDGHNLEVLIDTLTNVKRLEGPQFLHVVTKKGQGYAFAEDDPIAYHGPGRFDPGVGLAKPAPAPDAKPRPTYTQVFGDWLCDMAKLDRAPGGHHAGHARGLGHGALLAGVPRPLLRRRHRRAARRHLRRGPRLRRHEARRGDLLDVPAARLRPAHPRRGAAEPARRLRPRPRRARRRRRPHAPRRLRPLVPALHPQHDGDGARRRERMPPDALHRLHASTAPPPSATRAAPAPARRSCSR